MNAIAIRRRAILAAILLAAAAACADAVTSPNVAGTRAGMDETLPVDSTSCRSGYHLLNGRVVCNPVG